jgi:energy-coupling factor transporter ATP-binding protein EcfA2
MSENKFEVVLISGKMGSGKSTLALKLAEGFFNEEKGYRCHLINFADPLYEIHNRARGILADAGINIDLTRKDGNLLQLLGTEWGRNTIGPDIWVNVLKGRVLNTAKMMNYDERSLKHIFIIADCRFLNELDSFPWAFKIRLECDRDLRKERVSMWRDKEDHPSECGLDGMEDKFDVVIDSGMYPTATCYFIAKEKLLEKLGRR